MKTQKQGNAMTTKTHKMVYLKDGNGNKLVRKIRRDDDGLYVVRFGMKGRLKKTIIVDDSVEGYHLITVTRQVDYYI